LELEQQLLYLKQEQKSLKPLPPLSEDITNDYSSELKTAQIKLEQINNEVNSLREEKASNLLTLIHNLRSKTGNSRLLFLL
jgi:ABC-type phosphate transport system auxiliary subunit